MTDIKDGIQVNIRAVKEWIDAPAIDDWRCLCDNQSHLSGFFPCDAHGCVVEPTIGGHWNEKLVVCDACGRIMDQSTWNGVAVAVVGRRSS